MKDKLEFFNLLREVDGREPPDLTLLMGDYDFNRYTVKLSVAPAHRDDLHLPFVVRVSHAVAGFPEVLLTSPIRRTALEDFLTRKLAEAIERQATFDATGVARRRIVAPQPGQKILPRSTIQITDDYTDVRLAVRIPEQRGRVDGEAMQTIFFDDLPMIVTEALLYCNMDAQEINTFVGLMEDADAIRQGLPARGLIAFIGEGSLPARMPGGDGPDYERGLTISLAEGLGVTMEVPHAERTIGLGIASGITVLLGDADSGRIELMNALAAGIYNHVPGDGREYIVTMPDAVYVASEPGRSVQRVDLGSFGGDTDFSRASADASQSQAASLVEALEVGARVVLLDESDSSPSFLGTDHRIDALLAGEKTSATLADRVVQLKQELGVSTVVAGHTSVAGLIPHADTVLAIRDGVLADITKEAKAGLGDLPALPPPAYDYTHLIETARWVIPSSIDASVGRLDGVIDAPEIGVITFGRHRISLGSAHQVADIQQTLTLGLIIDYARQRYLDQARPIREVLDLVERDLSTEGLEHITREVRGDLARPRRYEIAAALNRLPSLRVARASL
jgi:predicted ABC-class ATPase